MGTLGRHARTRDSLESIALLKDGGFNHYRVARSLIPLLDTDTVKDDLGKRFDALFERVQGALT